MHPLSRQMDHMLLQLLKKLCAFPKIYMPSEGLSSYYTTPLSNRRNPIRKQVPPSVLVPRIQIGETTEDNIFCWLVPWFSLDLPGNKNLTLEYPENQGFCYSYNNKILCSFADISTWLVKCPLYCLLKSAPCIENCLPWTLEKVQG